MKPRLPNPSLHNRLLFQGALKDLNRKLITCLFFFPPENLLKAKVLLQLLITYQGFVGYIV